MIYNQDSIVFGKATEFAIRIIRLYKYLQKQNETVISKQILRSGTSIGANISEALYAQSQSDFISKFSIALKENSETQYWLYLLNKSEYLSQEQYQSLQNDCDELMKLLTSIVKTTKKKQTKQTYNR